MNSTLDNNQAETMKALSPNALVLNQLIVDDTMLWKIHNCKIIKKTATQNEPLPFLYYYDALAEDIRAAHPLTPKLLKHFQTLMYPKGFSDLLNIDNALVKVPWQVKVTGTLVMFNEHLQTALRLKFTNTAKQYDPIYTKTAKDAIKTAMKQWHFYGSVFVLNKHSQPLIATHDKNWVEIKRSDTYQSLAAEYSVTILALLEEHRNSLALLDDAIQLRLP